MSRPCTKVLQISDTHIFASPEGTLYGVPTAPALARVVAAILAGDERPDCILLTGDLVHDEAEPAYAHLGRLLAPLEQPVYCIPGNHDAPAVMAELSGETLCSEDSLDLGAWRVLLLNTHEPGQVGGAIGETQFDRLARQLAIEDKPLLVALHHHPIAIGSRWLDTIGVRDGVKLLEVLQKAQRVKAVVWGHIHQEWDELRGTLRLMGTPSTCVQFLPGAKDFAVDQRQPGWRWLYLFPDGRVETKVERLSL